MWNRFKNIIKPQHQEEEKVINPADAIDNAIDKMEDGIKRSSKALMEAITHQREIGDKLQMYINQAENFYQQAIQALQSGNEIRSQEFLDKKASVDKQVQEYKVLNHQISASVLHLEAQINKMKVKLEETKSQKLLLVARLESAKTQKEINEQMGELGIASEAFEEQSIKMALESGADFSDLEIDEALKAPSAKPALKPIPTIDELRKEAEEQEKLKKQREEANKQHKIETLFSQAFGKEEVKAPKKEDPSKNPLFQAGDNSKTKAVDDFMVTPPVPANPTPIDIPSPKKGKKDDVIEKFLATEGTADIKDVKRAIIEDFNKEEKKKKIIDDFFNQEKKDEEK